MLLTLGSPSASGAQGFQLSGRVFSVIDADTLALQRHWVVLHEVTSTGGRAVDSVRTDASGVYFLRSRSRDTSAAYMSSVTFLSISYFSTPVRATDFTSDTAATLLVYDTSSVAPPIFVRQRHIVVRAPEEDGTRSVLELLVLQNQGSVTRISNDTAAPVWQGIIPPNAFNLEVAPSDVSPDAVYRRGDSVALAAAVPPGESNQKQLVFGYMLPSGTRRLAIPFDQPIERVQVLIEDEGVEMEGGPLEALGAEQLDDIRFARFEAANVVGGVEASFSLSGSPVSVTGVLWMILAVSGVTMLIVFTVWLRRPEVVPADPLQVETLAAQAAALDEAFAAAGDNPSEAERQAYGKKRADLKARLANALARDRSK